MKKNYHNYLGLKMNQGLVVNKFKRKRSGYVFYLKCYLFRLLSFKIKIKKRSLKEKLK